MNENVIKLPNRMYVRVSTDEQKKKGHSPEAQKNLITNAIKQQGLKLDQKKPFYDDSGHSASIKEDQIIITIDEKYLIAKLPLNKRPHFKQALQDAKKGEKFNFWFKSWDRFSRNAVFGELTYILLKQYGINLMPVSDTKDPITRKVLSTFNQKYSEDLSKNISDGMKTRFENGLPAGKSPYGYKWDRDTKTLSEVPEQIEQIKKVFEFASQGIHYEKICSKVGISRTLYYSILQNKFYMGIVEYKGKTNTSSMPPIINTTTFEKANQNIKKKPKYF